MFIQKRFLNLQLFSYEFDVEFAKTGNSISNGKDDDRSARHKAAKTTSNGKDDFDRGKLNPGIIVPITWKN